MAHAEPGGQSAHSPAERALVVPLNVPASHSVTELAPGPHQPPASHASHAVAFDDDWKVPPAHSKHASRLLTFENPPGAHAIGLDERARQ